MSPQPERLILCTPGVNDYGIALLESITAMSESEFIATGFNQLVMQLKMKAEMMSGLVHFRSALLWLFINGLSRLWMIIKRIGWKYCPVCRSPKALFCPIALLRMTLNDTHELDVWLS